VGALGLVSAALIAGCDKDKPKGAGGVGSAAPSVSAAASVPVNAQAVGTPALDGKALLGKFQCNRCHDGTGLEAVPQNKHCVHCHTDIIEGRFKAPAASMAKWVPRVKDIQDAPSLEATGKRFRRSYLEQYLLLPTHVRPMLVQSMPRLAMTGAEAKAIAAHLAPEDKDEPAPKGDAGKGRALVDSKGCGTCHQMGGVPKLTASALPVTMSPADFARGMRLAPDLRHVRARFAPSRAAAWLQDPKAVKADTVMPTIPLTSSEVDDIVSYLYTVQLEAPDVRPMPERLPVLSRKVTFDEVDKKVFHRTCWHCHSEPDYAIGDGGPGNSGGFGFPPRALNLSDYNGLTAGFLNDKNERQSIFKPEKDGVPRLVRALLARHAEERGAATGEVRGMPLGYPALSLEDIQLVETWIAQGRPRT
jgi:cytochrome c5